MSSNIPSAAAKRLKVLEPMNAPRLHDQIYDDILVAGLDYSSDRAEMFHNGTSLLGALRTISADHTREVGIFGDMFGEYLELMGETSMKLGQFFSPDCLTGLMGRLAIDDHSLSGKPKMISDPCSGTGRFMLGVAKHFAEHNGGCLNFICVNVEKDLKLFTYCTMNAILHQIPSICIHGDALAVEVWDAFATIPLCEGQVRWARVPLETAKKLVVGMKTHADAVPPETALVQDDGDVY